MLNVTVYLRQACHMHRAARKQRANAPHVHSSEDSRGSKNWRDSNLLIPLKLGRALLSSERLGIPRTEPNERLGSILGHGFLDDSSKGIMQSLEYIRATTSIPGICNVNAPKNNVKR